MEKDYLLGVTEKGMKVTTLKTRKKDRGNSTGPMERFIMDSGKMVNNTGKEL